MSSKKILLELKDQLEGSINSTKVIIQQAINLGNYQAAADFQQQIIGRRFALALISEKLEEINLEQVLAYHLATK